MDRKHPDVEVLSIGHTLPWRAEDIIAALGPLVTESRLARFRTVLAQRTRTLLPVLDGLSDPHNGAAILRSADAFGCQEVHLVRGRFPFAVSDRVSRGTHRWLSLYEHEDAQSCCDALEAQGYAIYVAAMDGTVTPEQLAQVPKAAVVFGNEHRGVSEAFRARAAGVYAIPMVGFVESLNVSVASAITLYAASRGRQGDLPRADQDAALARFLLTQVRDAERIVQAHVDPHNTTSPAAPSRV